MLITEKRYIAFCCAMWNFWALPLISTLHSTIDILILQHHTPTHSNYGKACGCCLVCFSCSPSSIDHIYVSRFVLHCKPMMIHQQLATRLELWISLYLVIIIRIVCMYGAILAVNIMILPTVSSIECEVHS